MRETNINKHDVHSYKNYAAEHVCIGQAACLKCKAGCMLTCWCWCCWCCCCCCFCCWYWIDGPNMFTIKVAAPSKAIGRGEARKDAMPILAGAQYINYITCIRTRTMQPSMFQLVACLHGMSPPAQGVGIKCPNTETTVKNRMRCLVLEIRHKPTGRGMQATWMGLVSLALAGPNNLAG